MKLITKQIEASLPEPYETENVKTKDKVLLIKFFTPDSNWTWYVTEYDPENKLFFGFVDGIYPEWGCFSLYELENTKGPLGLNIERDIHWEPKKFSEVKAA